MTDFVLHCTGVCCSVIDSMRCRFDGCDPEQRSYPAMRDALNRTGRPVLLSVNGFNISNVQHAGKFANSWRTGGDDNDSLLNSLAPRIFKNNEFASYARPGQYNDPDMLEVQLLSAFFCPLSHVLAASAAYSLSYSVYLSSATIGG